MGVGCFNSQSINNNENKVFTNLLIQNNNNNLFLTPSNYEKIIKIQKTTKSFLNKIYFQRYIKLLLSKLLQDLDSIKLLNAEVITNSKLYKYYQELFQRGLFKPFSEHIKKNKSLLKQLNIMSKYTLDLPYYIVISQKLAYKGHLNLNKKYHGYGILYQFNNVYITVQ